MNLLSSASAFARHSVVVAKEGIYVWGNNKQGQLGLGHRQNIDTPVKLDAPFQPHEILSISCGAQHTLALTKEGKLYSWGFNETGQLGLGQCKRETLPVRISSLEGYKITFATTGSQFSMVITEDAKIFSWGANWNGCLGLGSTEHQSKPQEIRRRPFTRPIVTLALGIAHCLALDSEGGLWSWGQNANGQLGLGHVDNCLVPIKISLRKKIISIAAGDTISGAMSDNGEIFLWGCVFLLSKPRVVFPQQFCFPEKISSFSLGCLDFFFLTETGKIHYRRYNPSQTGDDDSFETMDFFFGSEIVKISVACHYFMAFTDSRNIFEWGDLIPGELGNGDHKDIDEPELLDFRFTPLQTIQTINRLWGKLYYWLFLGQQSPMSELYGLPQEVLFNFVELYI